MGKQLFFFQFLITLIHVHWHFACLLFTVCYIFIANFSPFRCFFFIHFNYLLYFIGVGVFARDKHSQVKENWFELIFVLVWIKSCVELFQLKFFLFPIHEQINNIIYNIIGSLDVFFFLDQCGAKRTLTDKKGVFVKTIITSFQWIIE